MTTTASDTSSKASNAYYARLAEMTPGERIRIGLALWVEGDKMQRAAIQRRHPKADGNEILYRLGVARFGEELARRVYRRQS